jgi:hypothetical protein
MGNRDGAQLWLVPGEIYSVTHGAPDVWVGFMCGQPAFGP